MIWATKKEVDTGYGKFTELWMEKFD